MKPILPFVVCGVLVAGSNAFAQAAPGSRARLDIRSGQHVAEIRVRRTKAPEAESLAN